MSDGPYRSLPMRQHWKDFAKRMEIKAHSAEEVSEALPVALRKDFTDINLDAVRSILEGRGQVGLFNEERVEQLEQVRITHCGSAAWGTLIDCAIAVARRGMSGQVAWIQAFGNALANYSQNIRRSIEEHYLRKGKSNQVGFIRGRLNDAFQKCDFGAIAKEFMAPVQRRSAARLQRRAGLDDGPSLP